MVCMLLQVGRVWIGEEEECFTSEHLSGDLCFGCDGRELF